MSAHETIYSARIAYPDYCVRGRAQTVSLPLYRSGALFAPTQAGSTFTLVSPSGVDVVAAAAVTVSGSIATYAIAAASLPSTLTLGHGYREKWSLVISGETDPRVYYRDAALVLHAAYPVLTDADLAGVYSDLTDHLASGTTTFQAYIDESWKRILGRLEAQGVFPDHVVSSWSLREVHMEITLHLIALDFARAAGGRWMELAASHKKEFEMAWQRLKFVRGTGSDGQADSDDQKPAAKGVTFINASPRASWRGFGGL